jgi:parvulin-like peptidyl-prolyl isomerase
MNPYIVPVVALVALLVLLGALLFDHFHGINVAASPTATPTSAPIVPTATPKPTATPIILATPLTTKAGVAAAVDGMPIPMRLYVDESNAAVSQLQVDHQDQTTGATIKGVDVRTATGKAAAKNARQVALKGLIQSYGIRAYGLKHGIVSTKKEIDTTLNNYYSQAGGKNAFLKMIMTEGFSLADVQDIATTSATINDVFAKVTANIPCKPCGMRHARQILLKATNKALAETIAKHLQVDKASDFAAYAKKYSTDTGSAKKGGDLGFFLQSDMTPEFGAAAFKLKMNEVSSPVKSTYGWHVIQVLGEKASPTQQNDYFTKWVAALQTKLAVTTYVQIP